MAKKSTTNNTIVAHVTDANRITAKNLYVNGDVYMTCSLNLKKYKRTPEIIKECDNLLARMDVTGDLFIQSDVVNCENAICLADITDYDSHDKAEIFDPYDINVTNSETFNSISPIKNVYLTASEVRLYGKLIVKGEITACSDEVLTRMRGVKINKLKNNIKK